MTKSLPTRPHIEALKKEAKRLQRSIPLGDITSLDLVKHHHPDYKDAISVESIKLQEAQLVVAREYGFSSWPDMVSELKSSDSEDEAKPDLGDAKMLHIVNGSHVLEQLEEIGFRGRFLEWREVLHEGRLHESFRGETYNRIRLDAIAEMGVSIDKERSLQALADRDALVESCADFEEVALWFEYDLYDQLQLLEILSRFDEARLLDLDLRLAFAEKNFLGNLSAEEKALLWKQRFRVSNQQIQEAHQIWELICQGRFLEVQELSHTQTLSTPGLNEALVRWFQEFPSSSNGLSRVERQILEALDEGQFDLVGMFRSSQSKEPAQYMGDSTFYYYVKRLTIGDRPLIRQTAGNAFLMPQESGYTDAFRAQRFELTAEGQDVLEGRADAIALRGIDKWIGGFHLTPENLLRWDENGQQLIE